MRPELSERTLMQAGLPLRAAAWLLVMSSAACGDHDKLPRDLDDARAAVEVEEDASLAIPPQRSEPEQPLDGGEEEDEALTETEETLDAHASTPSQPEEAGVLPVDGTQHDLDGALGAVDADRAEAASTLGEDAALVPAPPSKVCGEQCTQDRDCWPAELGFESCVDQRCTKQCASDDECSDKGARGRVACSDDGPGAAGPGCVALGVGARCAKLASAGCTAREWPRTRPHAVTGAALDVCITHVRCGADGCVSPCRSCGAGMPSSCDAVSGRCICRSDADCASVPNAPSCAPDSGRCVCGRDADCTDPRAPVCDLTRGGCRCDADEQCGAGQLCRSGSCVASCEDASSCARTLPNTALVCE